MFIVKAPLRVNMQPMRRPVRFVDFLSRPNIDVRYAGTAAGHETLAGYAALQNLTGDRRIVLAPTWEAALRGVGQSANEETGAMLGMVSSNEGGSKMIVRLMWPNCDYRNGAWGDPGPDAFWLECSPEEAKISVLPHLLGAQRQAAIELQDRQEWQTTWTFLVSRDLKWIQPLPESYPSSNLWNAYCPFVEIPCQPVDGLEEIKTLPLGPQSAGDNSFTKRMRAHQSWYRVQVLKVPYGTGPTKKSNSKYGNMLTKDAADEGRNFLSTRIHEVARRRLEQCREHKDGLIDEFRLLHHMMASQTMCFNLFAPLADDAVLASRFFSALLPGEVKEVLEVRFEYAPEPASKYLNDNTAFDAFVLYMGPDDQHRFIGIETKLTEPFSSKRYRIDSSEHRYAKWTQRGTSPWLESSWPDLDKTGHNQLWRDHMLVEALRAQGAEGITYSGGKLMLVRHPEDEHCAKVVEGYRKLLKEGDTSFVDMPLDVVLERWQSAAKPKEQNWLDEFKRRYLALDLSGEACEPALQPTS